jgi:hypothetical protein
MNVPTPFAQLRSLTHAPFSASRQMHQEMRTFAAQQGIQAKSAGSREGGSDLDIPIQKL